MLDSTTKEMIKGYFTEEQWDAIDSAMGDYQDYGDQEADTAQEVRSLIANLFN